MKIVKEDEDTEGQSGRWNKSEHQGFLEGLKLFGKNWKLVAGHIGSRNSTQVRSHAQKFFLREKSRLDVRQKAEEYYGRVVVDVSKCQKAEVGIQYGEGMTF